MSVGYVVVWAEGVTEPPRATYEEALAAVRSVLGTPKISREGGRTFFWAPGEPAGDANGPPPAGYIEARPRPRGSKAFELGRSDGIEDAHEDRTTVEQIARWYPGSPSDGLINALSREQLEEVLGVESLYGTGDRLTDAASEAIDDYDRGYLEGAREQALLNAGGGR